MVSDADYKIVRLRNGAPAVYSASYDETMHPGLGPAAEAEALYVRQLKIRQRMQQQSEQFVVWDIGLGAGANALTLLHRTRDLSCPLRIISFDETAEPFDFALSHADQLEYFHHYQNHARDLFDRGNIEFKENDRTVSWVFKRVDFPSWCAQEAKQRTQCWQPHAIFFDAFSPARNPAMWTLPLFRNLFALLNPDRPCSLTTYSRSTMLRVTLLLAGFFVGKGVATGLKEETTVAANVLNLLDNPLDRSWLERVKRSDSAEPLAQPVYRREPLSAENFEKLQSHQQFV